MGRDSYLCLAFWGARRPLEKQKTAIIDRPTDKICYYFSSFSSLCRNVVLGTASFCPSFLWIACSMPRRSGPALKNSVIHTHWRVRVVYFYSWCAPRICEIANDDPAKVQGIMHLRSSDYWKKWIFKNLCWKEYNFTYLKWYLCEFKYSEFTEHNAGTSFRMGICLSIRKILFWKRISLEFNEISNWRSWLFVQAI